MLGAWIWAISISLGFAIEPIVLWHAVPWKVEQTGSPQRLRGIQWLVVGLVAGVALAGCVAWTSFKWVLFAVMLGYGTLWMRRLYPGSILDG